MAESDGCRWRGYETVKYKEKVSLVQKISVKLIYSEKSREGC